MYSVRQICPEDKEQVLELIRKHVKDEPMNKAMKLWETPDGICTDVENYVVSSLGYGVSIAAYDERSRQIVGICINEIARRGEEDYTDRTDEIQNRKYAPLEKVVNHLDIASNIWEKLPSSCGIVLRVKVVCIHTEWRGRGLMKELCQEAEQIAKSIGARAMCMRTTSCYSVAAAERLGYRCVYRVMYKDLPFAPQPEPPHLDARVYLKEL